MSAKKKYFAVNFIHLIHKRCIFYLPLPISVTVSIFTLSAFILLLLPTLPSSSLPFHTVLSTLICYIKHVLKPFAVTSGEMLCHAVTFHINLIYIYTSRFINILEYMMIRIIFTDGVSGVKNLNACVLDFCVKHVV